MHNMTQANLEAAFAGESQAHMRYLIFAEVGEVCICELCGWTVEGERPDRCPLCGARRERFTAF